jgi:O-methyltransferase
MNLLGPFNHSAWKRLVQAYGRKWYPRLAPTLFDAKYVADGVMSKHDMGVLGANPGRRDYRFYLTRKLAERASRIDGMFVSLGVAQGDHALRIMREVGPGNPFWLVDSFDGRRSASDPSFKDGYVNDIDVIRDRFKAFPNVHLLQGVIPAVLIKLPDQPLAWVHLNLGDAESEIGALAELGPKLAPGGYMICDNFGRPATSDDQRRRFLSAIESNGHVAVVLPTGHALVLG